MSHVDEGTLHAYLDGELTPVERERVDTHLKGCPACQTRVAEERAIIERASRLLGMATAPERAMPPLEQLRQPRIGWRLRVPLAWAATVVLAVGLGWFARASLPKAMPRREAESDRVVAAAPAPATAAPATAAGATPEQDSRALAMAPTGRLSTRQEARNADTVNKDRDAERQAVATVTSGAASNALQAQESAAAVTGALDHKKTDVQAELPTVHPTSVAVREGRAATPVAQQPPPQPASVAALGQAQSGVVTVDGAAAGRRRAPALLTTSWPLIARQPAHDVLGVEPAVIPGFAVRAYRRNPAAREIAVEQVTDAGTTITLIERRTADAFADELRADSAAVNAPRAYAKAVNERLARFVGPLRIEIDGPLTPDSLSSLLDLAR